MATIKDVAHKAGVSTATVSHVLNRTRPVSLAVQERVAQAAEELHYQQNVVARSLRTRRGQTIGLAIPDIASPVFPSLVRGVQDAASRAGYTVILSNTDQQAEKERALLHMAQQGLLAGLIIDSAQLKAADFEEALHAGAAIVSLGSQADLLELDTITVDYLAGAKAAVSYLLELGHRQIGHIGGTRTTTGVLRYDGYRQALAAQMPAWDENLFAEVPFSRYGGYRGAQAILSIQPRPTAIFAADDVLAIGALFALRDAGLRVPEDISLIGFDDIDMAAVVSPPLTTVATPKRDLGLRAVELLLERITGAASGSGRHIVLPVELVKRGSAAAPQT